MITITKEFKVLVHIPHVSLEVPNELYENLLIERNLFNKYNNQMSDIRADKIVKENKLTNIIKAKYSRLYCDIERYVDDEKEEMSKYGMGVIYSNTYDGKNIMSVTNEYKEKIINLYYYPYHNKLTKLTKKLLSKNKKVLLLDCHTFSDEMASYKETKPFPDVCIGIIDEYTDNKEYMDYLEMIIKEYSLRGFNVMINYPYCGAIIPNNLTNEEERRVYPIMIEINKRILNKDYQITIQTY